MCPQSLPDPPVLSLGWTQDLYLPQPWLQEGAGQHLSGVWSPLTGMICSCGGSSWSYRSLPTDPGNRSSPLVAPCPEHIHWLLVSLLDHSGKPVFAYSLLVFEPQGGMQCQGPVICHIPHSLWLFPTIPGRLLLLPVSRPFPPKPSQASYFQSGRTVLPCLC